MLGSFPDAEGGTPRLLVFPPLLPGRISPRSRLPASPGSGLLLGDAALSMVSGDELRDAGLLAFPAAAFLGELLLASLLADARWCSVNLDGVGDGLSSLLESAVASLLAFPAAAFLGELLLASLLADARWCSVNLDDVDDGLLSKLGSAGLPRLESEEERRADFDGCTSEGKGEEEEAAPGAPDLRWTLKC